MTVRFKCQSEYQKSYRTSRSRSVSPQRSATIAGLRSDQMGISREPCLQRRRKLHRGGLTQSCSSLLFPQESQQTHQALKTAPPAASGSRSSHGRESALDVKPQTPPDAGAEPGPAAEPETPAGPRPAADPEPEPEPETAEKSVQPRPSKHDSQSQPSRPPTAAPNGPTPSNQHALRWRAGLRSGGQRLRGHQSEYNRQFSWKKPVTAASPLLTAEQMLSTSNRSVPPFKKNPVPVETEYQRSFQGLAPPSGPRKHPEQQRIPLFHTHMKHKKRREGSENKLHPSEGGSSPLKDEATPPPPPQVHRGHRILTEYESSFRSPLCRIPEEGGATDGDAPQVTELRQKALSYRQRAWGANFSRDHLSQLLSEHNALWEPTDTTSDSATVPPSPRPASEPRPDPDSCSSSRVEGLDLPSRSSSSSKRSSVVGSGENQNKNTQIKAQTPQSPVAGRRTAWGEEEEEENTDEEEGRLPTPRLKLLPVQRTHHDLTTPATGGAILVGKVKGSDGSSPFKQRSSSAVSMAAGAETAVSVPRKPKEAWSENSPSHHTSLGPSPEQKPAASPPSKPIKTKQRSPSPVAPPPLVPPPLHGIHGTLRHPDFQHNGELGARFRERPCSGGGSDEDDRLSVMSWRSAASCSMASAVLERAQKRRDNFWGKR